MQKPAPVMWYVPATHMIRTKTKTLITQPNTADHIAPVIRFALATPFAPAIREVVEAVVDILIPIGTRIKDPVISIFLHSYN